MQGQEIVADLLHCVESGSKPSTSTSEKQIGQPLLIVNLSICCAELELRDVLMLQWIVGEWTYLAHILSFRWGTAKSTTQGGIFDLLLYVTFD
jgi:hypothetical protein